MSPTAASELPDIALVLGQVLGRVPAEHQPLLLAIAERLAGERYRGWAEDFEAGARRDALVACAQREEEIARRIEGLFPDASSIQRQILEQNPDLEEINRTLFAGRPIAHQFTMQSQGERLGAATWRSLAKKTPEAPARDVYRACAKLEEASAVVLEGFLSEES